MDYIDRVEELFTRQGFTTSLRPGSSESVVELEAEKGDISIEIATTDQGEEHLLETARKLEEETDSDGRKIVFTDLELSSERRKELKSEVEGIGVEISFFQPRDGDEDIDLPENMPSSYEIIGDIAVLNLEDDQVENQKEIAKAVQKQNPNIETVLNKVESLSGEYRVGSYEKILGGDTETIYTEHGCRYRLDPTEVYFSERLGHERERVAGKIDEGEDVQVWFAGVGPYAVLFARERKPKIVHAIEKNPKACRYMEENVELNKVGNLVSTRCGDVREIVPEIGKADRIVMPLPKSAKEFLELAFNTCRSGGTIHYYRFAEKKDNEVKWEGVLEEVEEIAQKSGHEYEVLEKTVCGHYAPYQDRVCIDIKVM